MGPKGEIKKKKGRKREKKRKKKRRKKGKKEGKREKKGKKKKEEGRGSKNLFARKTSSSRRAKRDASGVLQKNGYRISKVQKHSQGMFVTSNSSFLSISNFDSSISFWRSLPFKAFEHRRSTKALIFGDQNLVYTFSKNYKYLSPT